MGRGGSSVWIDNMLTRKRERKKKAKGRIGRIRKIWRSWERKWVLWWEILGHELWLLKKKSPPHGLHMGVLKVLPLWGLPQSSDFLQQLLVLLISIYIYFKIILSLYIYLFFRINIYIICIYITHYITYM